MRRPESKRAQKKKGSGRSLTGVVCALLLLACAAPLSTFAQEIRQRSAAPSLTSEDLLNRPVLYVPQPATRAPEVASADNARLSAPVSYRDPHGAFRLSFPNGNWRVNNRAGRAGSVYSQRSFHKLEEEGFASATANVYVISTNLSMAEMARLSSEQQNEFAATLAARFLSSNASLVSVDPLYLGGRAVAFRVIADQIIARRAQVRAAITILERQGQVLVVVCRASLETFDVNAPEFDAIVNSLASSATARP